ncbi:MAG: hypothetical protein E7411_03820 [Ruminococcaceae bacterium]|nr:hypothetical protein [Oscillospiraceae bacterium]
MKCFMQFGGKMYNIIDFGAKNDGVTNSTFAVRKAVDECVKNGGGVVYIPYGTYVLASVQIFSNIHFVFEPGAKILGSLNPDDFDERENLNYPLYQDYSHSYFHRSMFWGENVENVSFSGMGIIDMREVWERDSENGEDEWRSRRAVKIISVKEGKNIDITDLKMYNATDLAVYLAGCENVRISGLTMHVNIDGISPDCCKNVVISDCNIVSGDDGIVLKSSYTLNRKQLCENIVVSNCTVSSRMCAIKLGTESNGGFKNIAISNCAVYDTCYTGVALEIADGGEIDGITVSGIVMKNVGTPFIIMLTDRRRAPEDTTIGKIKNIVIDNITATGPYGYIYPIRYTTTLPEGELHNKPLIIASSVIGQPDEKIENISLSNIFLTVPGGGTENDRNIIVPEVPDATPSARANGLTLPASGIYFRHAKNVTLNNVNIYTLKEDAREDMVFDDVDNLKK